MRSYLDLVDRPNYLLEDSFGADGTIILTEGLLDWLSSAVQKLAPGQAGLDMLTGLAQRFGSKNMIPVDSSRALVDKIIVPGSNSAASAIVRWVKSFIKTFWDDLLGVATGLNAPALLGAAATRVAGHPVEIPGWVGTLIILAVTAYTIKQLPEFVRSTLGLTRTLGITGARTDQAVGNIEEAISKALTNKFQDLKRYLTSMGIYNLVKPYIDKGKQDQQPATNPAAPTSASVANPAAPTAAPAKA